jgi:hypothetical protein
MLDFSARLRLNTNYAGDLTHRGNLCACGRADSPSLVLLTLAYIPFVPASIRIRHLAWRSIVPLRGPTNLGVKREEIFPG